MLNFCERRKFVEPGFSLAEILITLAILAVISIFTIPKFLNTNHNVNAKQTNLAKQAAFMLTVGFERYKSQNPSLQNLRSPDLINHINYVSKLPDGTIVDDARGGATITCSGGLPSCYRLHNGGILQVWKDGFCASGSNPTAIPFRFDPDGIYGGTSNGDSKSIILFLYDDGRILTKGTVLSNTRWTGLNPPSIACDHTVNAVAAQEPEWFDGF